jgi:hypothetical protein
MRYSPWPFPVPERSTPLAGSRTVSVAFVTTLFFESFTLTCRLPVAELWAKPNVVRASIRTSSEPSFRMVTKFLHKLD